MSAARITIPAVLRAAHDAARERAPARLGEARSRVWSSMAKLWYGNPELHYEAWYRSRLDVIELGLHFESEPLTNARLLGAFRARAKEVGRALPEARIEPWDKGWARVWQPLQAHPVNAELRDTLVDLFARYVATLEPILRDELPIDVAWHVSAGSRAPARTASRPRAAARRSRATSSASGGRTRSRPR